MDIEFHEDTSETIPQINESCSLRYSSIKEPKEIKESAKFENNDSPKT